LLLDFIGALILLLDFVGDLIKFVYTWPSTRGQVREMRWKHVLLIKFNHISELVMNKLVRKVLDEVSE